MTWIRWDTATPRADVVGFLADRLALEPALALGLYNAMCCGFGDHQVEGRLDQVPDATVEAWAMWRGRRGRFAAAIREWCAKSEETGGDPGELRGWWRQQALLRKQQKDAGRPDGRTKSHPPGDNGKSPVNPPGDLRESPANPTGATNERTNDGRTDAFAGNYPAAVAEALRPAFSITPGHAGKLLATAQATDHPMVREYGIDLLVKAAGAYARKALDQSPEQFRFWSPRKFVADLGFWLDYVRPGGGVEAVRAAP